MKSLAAIPSILIVAAALSALALWLLRRTQEQGRNGLRWVFALLGTWLGALALAAFGTRLGYERFYHAKPGFLMVCAPAVLAAFLAALLFAWVLGRRRKRDQSPPPSTSPPSTEAKPVPSPVTPPAPSMTTFKFACLDCGQRIEVALEEVGTSGNCPNCQAPLVVPPPSNG
jgi:hypothetical protein